MPLDAEKQVRRCRVPRVLLRDWLVDTTSVLAASETIVLHVVDQLDEKDADEAVAELEYDSFGTQEAVYGNQYSAVDS